MERDPEEQWVLARLNAIAPSWTPDATLARALVRPERPERRRVARYGVAAVAVTLLAAFTLAEPVRTAAQALWYRMVVSRIDVVRLDFTAVPLDTHVRTDGVHVSVPTLEEAATRAGFVPRLPSTDVVAGEAPALTVTSRFEVTQTLRSDDLRAALARVGATDLEVPDAWNGATVGGDHRSAGDRRVSERRVHRAVGADPAARADRIVARTSRGGDVPNRRVLVVGGTHAGRGIRGVACLAAGRARG